MSVSARSHRRSACLICVVLLSAWLGAPIATELALTACAAEVSRARDSLVKIFKEWPLRPSTDAASEALQSIASALAERSGEQRHRHWRSHIVRDSKLNAFSIGDGHIFVTEGMLRFVDSEAELAALLSHEFGHHIAGHFCRHTESAGFFRNFFSRGDDGNGPQVGELTASIDPEKEREADRIGAVILERGGYNPRTAIFLAARMAAAGVPAHFNYSQRIDALEEFLVGRAQASWLEVNSASFERIKTTLAPTPLAP